MGALPQHNGAVAVPKDPMLPMPLNGARKHKAFSIASHLRKLSRPRGMIHADHGLLDDRPLVEIRRDIMSRRADHLHTRACAWV